MGEKFGGKNLNYSMVVGPYKNFWQGTFGEVADELDETFLEGVGLSQIDARKNIEQVLIIKKMNIL